METPLKGQRCVMVECQNHVHQEADKVLREGADCILKTYSIEKNGVRQLETKMKWCPNDTPKVPFGLSVYVPFTLPHLALRETTKSCFILSEGYALS